MEIFPGRCSFCTYPAWEAPVELATSCMCDKCQVLEESAILIGDLTIELQHAIPVSALTGIVPSSSSVRRSMAYSSSCSSSIQTRSGPIDSDVLWMQPKHVSEHVWNGEPDRKLHIRRAVSTYQGEEHIPEEIEGEIEGSVVKLSWLAHHFSHINIDEGNVEQLQRFTRAWILRFIGGVLFVNKSSSRVSLRYLQFLCDFEQCSTYAWGPAVLAYLYREMCSATDYKVKSI
ncbi:Protein MAIN-LIKE 2 [Glycine soja]